jgi:glycosyltransferase involved in cell wall biosynthesis
LTYTHIAAVSARQLKPNLIKRHTKINRIFDNKKIMLFTNCIDNSPPGGRELLCKLNHDALKEIFGDDLILCEVPKAKLYGLTQFLNAFKGRIDGLNDALIANALQTLRSEKVAKVFVDGSGFGEFVKTAKKEFPRLEICTFFHNVEARFFWGSLRQSKTLHSLAVMIVNYLAERKAVRYSDKLICLSERDSGLLDKLYGRKATNVLPMAVRDIAPPEHARRKNVSNKKYALFVGGGFYANRAGICWFVENVVPRIGIKTYIVGRGLDELKQQFEQNEKVVVVGAVDSLADWYSNACFVIAPVFDGSGMKTKVAEALMFGKKIVGTPEAFSGYQDVAYQAGWVCSTADEFVAAIGAAGDTVVLPFDKELRELYEVKYSFSAARSRLEEILGAES